jgi:hypothetical protein
VASQEKLSFLEFNNDNNNLLLLLSLSSSSSSSGMFHSFLQFCFFTSGGGEGQMPSLLKSRILSGIEPATSRLVAHTPVYNRPHKAVDPNKLYANTHILCYHSLIHKILISETAIATKTMAEKRSQCVLYMLRMSAIFARTLSTQSNRECTSALFWGTPYV